MKIAFIIDPITGFNPQAETTFFIMREMCRRGWEVWGIEVSGLFQRDDTVSGIATQYRISESDGEFRRQTLQIGAIPLKRFNAVILRKDPPVTTTYIDHLSLLETLEDRVFMTNSPSGIKSAGEKLLPLSFPEFSPPTLVSSHVNLLREFVIKYGRAVLKPLNLSGGRGIVIARGDDPSLASLIDLLTEQGTKYILAQKHLPEARRGDKRILLLNGEVLGAFLRVPSRDDFRGNLHSGATFKKAALTTRDRKIVAALKPELAKRKLHFVGLDLIGEWLTEINVTSPMGIRELNSLSGQRIEKQFVDWIKTMG